MKNFRLKQLTVLMVLAAMILACSTVPITGRKQFAVIPESQINAMSFSQYDQFLAEHKLSTDKEQTAMVKRVGGKIQGAVERYFADIGQSASLRNYDWEFNLIEDEQANAWCMPGGKVVVYTGLLPITQNEAGVAVVMGHEIAHAIAQHGNERMSQGLVTQFGGMALAKALEDKPEETQNLFMTAFGLGATVGVLLPYSRMHESEADHMGLIFMAMAGYDPNLSLDFWQRMADDKGGAAPPEFLSTHPSDQTRINNIQELLPEAMKYYKR
jgi:predicted Zn-dependent protease